MADRRRVTVSTPRGPFEVEVSALLPQTDLSVEVAPAADSEEPQRQQRRPLDYAQLPSDEEGGVQEPAEPGKAVRAPDHQARSVGLHSIRAAPTNVRLL